MIHRTTSRHQFEQVKSELQQPRPTSGRGGGKSRERSVSHLVSQFWRVLRGHRLALFTSLLTLTIATILALLPPAATKFLVDYVLGDQLLPGAVPAWVPREPWPLLLAMTLFVLAVSLVKTGFHIWSRWQATRITKLVQMSVRKRVFDHAVRLPLHRIQELKSGGAASILRQDAGSVGELVFGMLYNPWRALIQLVGSLVILAWVDWRLLLGALGIIPVVYLTHRTWINRIRPQHRRVRAQREEVDGLATESFGGMRVVRAFSRQRSETNRIMRGNHLMGRLELMAWWWTRMIEIVWETIIPIASAILMAYGGYRVLQGELTLGDLMMFLVYLLMLLEPLAVLAQSAATFQNSLSGFDRILDLLDEPREMATDRELERLVPEQISGKVGFHDVRFTYPGGAVEALREIRLEVMPGETVALVGPSGAGKTTLCNLVARFYQPTSGTMTIDDRDVSDFDVESYRELVGIVEQDVFLFDGTVAQNLAYGNLHATSAELQAAAQAANAEEFIAKLPEGYDTVIGERGVKLSGGQRQRLAIARAILADPKILILDEATSNLDTESERLIQSSLQRLMQHRTCFVIAHRLSTIMHADRILVIEDGTITEEGTHETLIRDNGRYADMVRLQTEPAAQPTELLDSPPS